MPTSSAPSHFTPNADVVAAKFSDADDGNSNCVLVHDFLLASVSSSLRNFPERKPEWRCRASSAARIRASRSKAKCSPGVDGKSGGVRAAHHFDGFQSNYRHIEAHVLAGLADFHDDQALATGDAGGALDGFVGAFHGFDGDAGAVADHDRLAQVQRRRFARDCDGRIRCLRLRLASGARRVSTPGSGKQRAEEFRGVHQFDSFVFAARGPRRQSASPCSSKGARVAISPDANPGESS